MADLKVMSATRKIVETDHEEVVDKLKARSAAALTKYAILHLLANLDG